MQGQKKIDSIMEIDSSWVRMVFTGTLKLLGTKYQAGRKGLVEGNLVMVHTGSRS